MTQINWQLQPSNRAGGYIVTNTDWNDIAADLRALIDQTTSSASDNTPLPIGIDLVNDRVYISDPDSTTPEDGNHADTTLSVVGTTTLAGATQQTGTFTVGVNDTGHDVIFYGATASAYMKWDQANDDLVLAGAAGLDVAGDIDVDGTANLDAVDIDGTVQADGTITVGANTDGYDVKFFGNTTGKYLLWDESEDALTLVGADLVVDTDCLYVDSSNNAVGINTTSPVGSGFTIGRQPSDANEGGQLNFEGGTSYSNAMFLDRYGNDLRLVYNGSVVGQWSSIGTLNIYDAGQLILGTGSDLKVYANGSNSYIDHSGDGDLYIRTLGAGEDIFINAKDALALQTDGTSRIYIDAATNVGIATTSPHEKLDVHGNIAVNPEITFVPLTDGNAIGYINFHGYQGGATQYRDLGIYNGRQGVMAVFDGSASRVAIMQVAASAYETLDVNGNIAWNNELTASTGTNGNALGYINFHGYQGGNTQYRDLGIYNGREGVIAFFDGSSAQCVMGTATAFDTTSYLRLQVLNGVSTKVAGTGATSQMSFFNDNGRVGYIGTSGTATTYYESSDYRLKENVAPITGAVDRLSNLKPVRFNFITDAATTLDGFLAHEVAGVVPEAVGGEKDAMRTIAAVEAVEAVAAVEYAAATYDDDRNELTPEVLHVPAVEAVEAVAEYEVNDTQMIDKGKLIPLLTAAVQELTTRIAALEAA